MDRDWNDRVISDSYSIMMTVADQARRSSVVLIGIHLLAGFFLSIGVYIFRTVNADSEAPRELPVKMEFSFAVLESPLFECVLAWQMFYVVTLALVVGMINGLLATLVSLQWFIVNLFKTSSKSLFTISKYMKIS